MTSNPPIFGEKPVLVQNVYPDKRLDLQAFYVKRDKGTGKIKIGQSKIFKSGVEVTSIRSIIEECSIDPVTGLLSSNRTYEAVKSRRVAGSAQNEIEILAHGLLIQKVNGDDDRDLKTAPVIPISDKLVHNEMLRFAGVSNYKHHANDTTREWFDITEEQALSFISNTCMNDWNLSSFEKKEIVLYREQREAVDKAKCYLTNTSKNRMLKFLFNAVPRFGKTYASMILFKELNLSHLLIMSHRTSTEKEWYDAFVELGFPEEGFQFVSRNFGVRTHDADYSKPTVRFLSLQDARGSYDEDLEDVAINQSESEVEEGLSNLKKNHQIFENDWGIVFVDEVHEGTTTPLAKRVLKDIPHNKELLISGTPYKISSSFSEEARFDFDYGKECEYRRIAEAAGETTYDNRPKILFRALQLRGEALAKFEKSDGSFSFGHMLGARETSKGFEFNHPESATALIDFFAGQDPTGENKRLLPFATPENRELFAHGVWVMPSVASANAMEELLNNHIAFERYKVLNATSDTLRKAHPNFKSALEVVLHSTKNEERTITLTVDQLLTGSTVPRWTYIMMLSNTKSATQYMQSAFRVKSPGIIKVGEDLVQKELGVVFEPSPIRMLEVLREAAEESLDKKTIAERAGINVGIVENSEEYESALKDKLKQIHYDLDVLYQKESGFVERDFELIMRDFRKIEIRKIANNGFSSPLLFDRKAIEKELEISALSANTLLSAVGVFHGGKQSKSNVTINAHPFSEQDKSLKEKNKGDLTEEEKERLNEARLRENRKKKDALEFRKTLLAVSVRIPMLILGVKDVPEEGVTVSNLPYLIDEESWDEFMPKGFKRFSPNEEDPLTWKYFTKFVDHDAFAGACDSIRMRVQKANTLDPIHRALELAALMMTFKNPDRETVLTPFGVVAMHYIKTFGGYSIVDEDGKFFCDDELTRDYAGIEADGAEISPKWFPPRTKDATESIEMQKIWNRGSKVIDTNSKTALYPLHITLSKFLVETYGKSLTEESQKDIWNGIIKNDVFVNTRTKVAANIARKMLGDEANVSTVDIVKVEEPFKGLKNINTDIIYKWVFNPNDFGNVESRGQRITGVYNESVASVEKSNDQLLKILEEAEKYCENSTDSDSKFFAVLSNPPYQDEASNPIFQIFQKVGSAIGKHVSMIYMASRWWYGSSKGLGAFREQILTDKKLASIVFYDTEETSKYVFKGIEISGGVSIVTMSNTESDTYTLTSGVSGDSVTLEKDTGFQPLNLRYHELTSTVSKAMNERGVKSLFENKKFVKNEGVLTSDKLKELNPKKGKKPTANRVVFFGNISSSRGGKSDYYTIDTPEGFTPRDTYAVCFGQSIVENESRKLRIYTLDKGVMFGRSTVSYGMFETEEELLNAELYGNTSFFETLFRSTIAGRSAAMGYFVPDLEDYSNANPLFSQLLGSKSDKIAELDRRLWQEFAPSVEQTFSELQELPEPEST